VAHENQPIDTDLYDPSQSRTQNLTFLAWKHKSIIILCLVVSAVLGGLYYLQQPAVYQSTAQLHIIKKDSAALSLQGIDQYQYEDYMATQLRVVRSPRVIRKAVEIGKLAELPSFAGVDPTASIMRSLTATRDTKDSNGSINVIDLAYTGSSAEECQAVLAAVIASYKEYLSGKGREDTTKLIDFIKTSMNELDERRDKLQTEYQEFRKNTPVLPRSKEGTPLQYERLLSIETKRVATAMRRAELVGRINAVREAVREKRDPTLLLTAPIDSSKLWGADSSTSGLDVHLLQLTLEKKKLLDAFGEDHPDVMSINERIQITKDFIKNQSDNRLSQSITTDKPMTPEEIQLRLKAYERELEELRVTEKALSDFYENQQRGLQALSQYELKEEHFRQKTAQIAQLSAQITDTWQKVDLLREHGGYNAEPIAEPNRGKRIGPSIVKAFALAIFFGLFAGLGLAWLAEVSDRSFRTPEEVRRRLGVAVVSHIPYMQPDEEIIEKARASGTNLDPSLCTFFCSKSVDAEAYRGVRTAIYFSMEGDGHKVLQITSPNTGDGKSTLAANLAVSIAQSGKSILLIDADCRRPRLHKVFGLSSRAGLATVISGESELNDAIQSTPIPNLSVLPCGPRPSNPAELLTSPRFKELIDTLRERYDFVLIDTPPLLAVSDPSVVAPRVDGVLLTIRVTKNGRPDAERSKDMLQTLGATIVGVVVNGVGKRGEGYENRRYSYGYSYNYHYGYTYEPAGDGNKYYQETDSNSEINLDNQPPDTTGGTNGDSGSAVNLGGEQARRLPGDSSLHRRRSGSTQRPRTSGRKESRRGALGWLRRLWF
jgi:capsular exopolysaccharide synthesis family protein